MKIGVIDVDGHNFPNIPLMKLSAWHKKNGDSVEWSKYFFGCQTSSSRCDKINIFPRLFMCEKITVFPNPVATATRNEPLSVRSIMSTHSC